MSKIKYKVEKNKTNKVKFLVASSSIRFLARIIDLIILFIILFFSGISIFYHGVYDLTNHNVTYGDFISMMFGRNLSGYSNETLSLMFIG